jgi:ribosomal protein S18 acetylase RimI-like enzyme
VRYSTTIDGIRPDQLVGFFEGWPDPPTPERHLDILRNSSHVVLALDGDVVVGFMTAISDGVLAAYIPLLEVRKEARGKGVGTQLAKQMLEQLSSMYMVDLVCDEDVLPFYERLGMRRYTGAILRNATALRG